MVKKEMEKFGNPILRKGKLSKNKKSNLKKCVKLTQ